MTGPADAGVTPDPDAAEEYAEEISVDPTQEEINHYQQLEGEAVADDEPADAGTPLPD